MPPVFFATPRDLQKWFRQNHATTNELWVGYYKKATGKLSITWRESVDEALCVGWIDGLRKTIDTESYQIRFTPRRRGSIWSAVNIKRAEALISEGRMLPAGAAAFALRRENRSGIYSYEQRGDQLPEPYQSHLKSNFVAWKFYQAQPSSYRKATAWWVINAKQESTRERRLKKLIDFCRRKKRIL